MAEYNQSSKSLEGTETENSKPNKEGKIQDETVGKTDEYRRVRSFGSDCMVENTSTEVEKESKASEFVILPSVHLSEGDFQSDFYATSHLLSEVPVEYSLQPLDSDAELMNQVRAIGEEPLIGNTGQSSQVVTPDKIKVPDDTSKLKLSPIENGNNPCLTEQGRQNSLNPKRLPALAPRTYSDGYNWRKYGQKQVKRPEGSRSYYRCTFSDCYAKKIECCDRSNHVIETIYKSHHNHAAPQKVNCTKENKCAPSAVEANGSRNVDHVARDLNDSITEEPLVEMAQIPKTNQQDSTDSDETVETNTKEEHIDEYELKKRLKKSVTGDVESFSKPEKKPKIVVQTAGDVGISGDGYRWRKYGQKMVKGKPYPRNYYRCTSVGCPVRKHIERAIDSSSAVIISYTGIHDHDMPSPKISHGSASDHPAPAAAAPTSMNNVPTDETKP